MMTPVSGPPTTIASRVATASWVGGLALCMGLTACSSNSTKSAQTPPASARTVAPDSNPGTPTPLATDSGGPSGADKAAARAEKKKNKENVNPQAPVAPAIAQVGLGLPNSDQLKCPPATVHVSTAASLKKALDAARPGDVIALAAGTYTGAFVAKNSGTAQEPIYLCGSSGAVLAGQQIQSGYVLHLDHASYWRLIGFSVTNGQKGVVLDGSKRSFVQGLTVDHIGDEGIHLRNFTTDTVVLDNTVMNTGLRNKKFGEGIYIGTAKSNWCTVTDCKVDNSDRNVIKGNNVRNTTAEGVDIKEGTTGGAVLGNTFDGSGLTGADSWVDVKGNGWLIADNHGTNSPMDGYQQHSVLNGWGTSNVFRGNTGSNIRGEVVKLTTAGNVIQ